MPPFGCRYYISKAPYPIGEPPFPDGVLPLSTFQIYKNGIHNALTPGRADMLSEFSGLDWEPIFPVSAGFSFTCFLKAAKCMIDFARVT